jgi:hypothetical protein
MAILPSLADLFLEVLIISTSHRGNGTVGCSRMITRMTYTNLDEIAWLYKALSDSMDILTFHLY